MTAQASSPLVPLYTSANYAKIPAEPGTHVFIIGAGHYPHLPNGGEEPASETLGLRQLTSPPASAKALATWFLASAAGVSALGFRNPDAPLASLWMLVSALDRTYALPSGQTVGLERASLDNIRRVYKAWITAVGSHPGNNGVFYFCGHGVQGVDSYLFADDIGSDLNIWANAFDVDMTVMAARQHVAATLYFFVDACRQFEITAEASRPQHLGPMLDQHGKPKCLSLLRLWAAGEGSKAFADKVDAPSRFTSALLQALNGSYGQLSETGSGWVITGEALAHQVVRLVAQGNHPSDPDNFQQAVPEPIGSQPFQYFADRPAVVDGVASPGRLANPLVRAEIARMVAGESLPFVVLERFAERLEAQSLKIEELQSELQKDHEHYEGNRAFLNAEPDSELVRKAKEFNEAGAFQQAGLVLDEIIAQKEERNARTKLLSDIELGNVYVARAQNWLLQQKRPEALEMYRKAYELVPTDSRFALAFGGLLMLIQHHSEAQGVLEKLVVQLEALSPVEQEPLMPQFAEAHARLGFLYFQMKGLKAMKCAEINLRRAVRLFEQLAHADPTRYRSPLGDALSKWGIFTCETKRFEEAEAAFRLEVQLARQGTSDDDRQSQKELIGALANLSTARRSRGRLEKALAAIEEAKSILEVWDPDHADSFASLRALVANDTATVLLHCEPPRFEEAKRCLLEAIDIAEGLARKDPVVYQKEVWGPHVNLGLAHMRMGQYADAEAALRKAWDVNVQLFKARPKENEARLSIVYARLLALYDEAFKPEAMFKLQQEWQELMGELWS